ncbi:UNVERIFIED_CONTAM: hypothetical protein K2H54_045034 [Gekko kuhli]
MLLDETPSTLPGAKGAGEEEGDRILFPCRQRVVESAAPDLRGVSSRAQQGSRSIPHLLCQPCRRLVYLLRVPSSTGSVFLTGVVSPPPPPAPGLAAAELGLLLLPPPPSGLPAAAPAAAAWRPDSPRPAEEQGEEPADVGRLLLRLLLLLPPPGTAAPSGPPCAAAAAAAFSMEPPGRDGSRSGLGCGELPPAGWPMPDSYAGRAGKMKKGRPGAGPAAASSSSCCCCCCGRRVGSAAAALCARTARDPPRPRASPKPGLSRQAQLRISASSLQREGRQAETPPPSRGSEASAEEEAATQLVPLPPRLSFGSASKRWPAFLRHLRAAPHARLRVGGLPRGATPSAPENRALGAQPPQKEPPWGVLLRF